MLVDDLWSAVKAALGLRELLEKRDEVIDYKGRQQACKSPNDKMLVILIAQANVSSKARCTHV